jgi:hypothetical protein
MAIYRVTFTTDLLVEADSLPNAIRIGYANLEEEVKNRFSKHLQPVRITSIDQLKDGEHNSLPWRDPSRRNDPELEVEILLEEMILELEVDKILTNMSSKKQVGYIRQLDTNGESIRIGKENNNSSDILFEGGFDLKYLEALLEHFKLSSAINFEIINGKFAILHS